MEPWLFTLCLCIVLTLSAVAYDQLTKRIPSRLHAQQAPESAFGLVRADKLNLQTRSHGIEQVSASQFLEALLILRSIIFVHGLGSNPDTTWGLKDANWVSDFLPQDIPTTLRDDVRIFFYNYDSYWKRDALQVRLSDLGKSLLAHITSKIRITAVVGSCCIAKGLMEC